MPDLDTVIGSGIRIGATSLVAVLLLLILGRAIGPFIRATVRAQMSAESPAEVDKRIATLTSVVYRTSMIVIVAIAFMVIMPEVGINIGPFLAGAGLAGLAIGFGAQSLVKDGINGFFILVENQYAKGDVINAAGIGGLVEDVNLRRTLLRDLDGAVHSVPNSAIIVASNLTRGTSRVNMNIQVAYTEDLDHVIEVINRVGQELAGDPRFGSLIIDPPKVLRIEDFADSGIVIKILGETEPIRQWDVMGELRLRLKKAFDAEGIEFPFPHRLPVTGGAKAHLGPNSAGA
jgi:small conductance mechanosensitive channel